MKNLFSKPNVDAILLFIVILIIYIFTANTDVTYTDNGELAAACAMLGIAHPTGYPLFTLLGHLWSLIPFGFSKIYSLNLFAAILTALSSIVLFYTSLMILSNAKFRNKQIIEGSQKRKRHIDISYQNLDLSSFSQIIISLIIALTYGLAQTIWEQANSLEVYSLQLLLMNLVIFFVLKAYFSHSKKYYFITAFCLGLTMSNHLTGILLVPAILWLYFFDEKRKFRITADKFKFIIILLVPFIVALSVYIYLPIRSAMLPAVNWGWVHRGFSKFMYHISGGQYQVWMFSGASVILKNIGKFFSLLPYQFGIFGLILAFWGIVKVWKSSDLFWFFILLIAANLFYTLNYSIFDIDPYFSLSFIALLIFAVIGAAFIVRNNQKLVYIIVFIPVFEFFLNFQDCDHSHDKMVAEYTKNVLASMESNAILISSQWDYFVGPFMYEQIVEHKRSDVVIVEKELMRRTWYPLQFELQYPQIYSSAKNEFEAYKTILDDFEEKRPYDNIEIQTRYVNVFKKIINENIDSHPIYMTMDVYATEKDMFQDFYVAPHGLVLQVFPKDTIVSVSIDNLDFKYLLKNRNKYEGILPKNLPLLISDNLTNNGIYAYKNNQKEKAIQILSLALEFNPNNPNARRILSIIE
ncbi:MAG TPA: DUF2723 domain-containing protein [Candidatus Kapabacteria bacterium]|jgi:hypothetical protein|nr:DUF2723 domain-containing protein [Candidatus Kapabacteria bacterium]